MEDQSLNQIVRSAVYFGRFLKWAHAQGLVRDFRSRASRTLFQRLHTDVIHKMREFAFFAEDLSADASEHVGCLARDTATACRDLVADLLELQDGKLHCCIKVFGQPEGVKERVVTLARSIPQDSHPDDNNPAANHFVDNNSVWAALLGKSDGGRNWARPYPCFCCNDLVSVGPAFKCSREDWREHYRSTLVYPLRFVRDPAQRRFGTIGFLAFYSQQAGVFPGLPSIFEHNLSFDDYFARLSASTVFQVGACMNDTLSTFLSPVYHSSRTPLPFPTQKAQ